VDASQGLPAEVDLVEHLGDVLLVHCRLPGMDEAVTVKCAPGSVQPARHEVVRLMPQAAQLLLFDGEGRNLSAHA
jgi:multiple sugar transport system ATP-binding protein